MKNIYSSAALFLILFITVHFQMHGQGPCNGAPAANSVVSPSVLLCPGMSTTLGLASPYNNTGLTYQWMVSTISTVGPFTVIPGATLTTYTTPTLNINSWYSCQIVCMTNTTWATSATVTVQGVITNTVPYYEDFQSISVNNQLPNCSWQASNLGSASLTYTASPKNAAFYYNPPGINNFYSNGIQLNAGITYSAGLWYKTDNSGGQNWANLSILVGPNQSTTSQFSVASTNGPAASSVWTLLANTFTVPSSGIYYLAIRGTGTNTGNAQYLSWDDLFVTIPCSLNSPTLNLSASTSTVCSGDSFVLMATGADTYTWNTGSNSPVITVTAQIFGNPATTIYNVNGTYTLTGCDASASVSIVVNPSPVIFITVAPTPVICAGSSVTLTAQGASSYAWSNGGSANSIVVTPFANTGYTVYGTNSYGCSGTYVSLINVNALPFISLAGSTNSLCAGGSGTLNASPSGLTYNWTSGSAPLSGNPAIVSPSVTSSYTVTGVNTNGCSNSAAQVISVYTVPILSISGAGGTLCAGETTIVTASGASNYQWAGLVSASNSATVSPLTTQNYTLTGMADNGCSSTLVFQVIVNECLDVNETAGGNVAWKLYPNPSKDEFFLELTSYEGCSVTISDLYGKEILRLVPQGGPINIQLSAVKAGIYFGTIRRGDGVTMFKMVKE